MVNLARLATYRIPSSTANLVVARGSVVDFVYPPNPNRAAIVNAANVVCLGGGGVDGAISSAGGPNLLEDREALPVLAGNIRCPTGNAKLTGPNSYGSLQVPFVIHAVGPCYFEYPDFEEPDQLLSMAYKSSLECACGAQLNGLAFSLLSAGVYRGERELNDVLRIGVQAICDFVSSQECTLQEIFMCAFNAKEADMLQGIAEVLKLEEQEVHSSDTES